MKLEFDVTFDPAHDDNMQLAAGLNAHAETLLPRRGFNPAAIFVRDAQHCIRGGVSAYLNWNWLHVSLLWVDESLRGGGYGTRLMRRIEAIGYDRGCRNAHVDTFSFQAREFYESLGYEVFARLADYPQGHARYFLQKRLTGKVTGP